MSSADLAAAAAFTAAGLSLVNVVITAWLGRRGQREQWRREQERPIVARCLSLSAEARVEWGAAAVARRAMGEGDAWVGSDGERRTQRGLQLMRDLYYEFAQLDLLASPAVRHVAARLIRAHEPSPAWLVGAKTDEDDFESWLAKADAIREEEAALIERARTDLGLGSGLQVPPRSLLAKILARTRA